MNNYYIQLVNMLSGVYHHQEKNNFSLF